MIFETYYPPTIVLGYLVVVLSCASLFEAVLKGMTKWREKKDFCGVHSQLAGSK